MTQKPSSLDIQFLANTRVNLAATTLLHIGQERTHVRFRPGPPFTIQIQAVAYENQGSVAYLRDLFAVLETNLV